MSVDAWITAGMLVVMLSALATSRFGADLVVVGALLMLILLGVVEPADAIRNFANPAVITIGFLYVVAAGLKETGAINVLTARLLGHPKSALQAQMRLIFPVAALSRTGRRAALSGRIAVWQFMHVAVSGTFACGDSSTWEWQ